MAHLGSWIRALLAPVSVIILLWQLCGLVALRFDIIGACRATCCSADRRLTLCFRPLKADTSDIDRASLLFSFEFSQAESASLTRSRGLMDHHFVRDANESQRKKARSPGGYNIFVRFENMLS